MHLESEIGTVRFAGKSFQTELTFKKLGCAHVMTNLSASHFTGYCIMCLIWLLSDGVLLGITRRTARKTGECVQCH